MTEPRLIVPFGVDAPAVEADVAAIGGKAASLIRLVNAGLPVPPGVALTAAFFEPWFDALRDTPQWAALVNAAPDDRAAACEALIRRSDALRPDPGQQAALDDAREVLGDGLFAVRSSSPEEDLTGASFAGGYRTVLGVPPEGLLDAARRCFASSLDERVLVYKEQHGFDPLAPRIAVVIQRQIDSAIAGVGFSLNPLNNDYDEAVFDAAWGLGESVVSGAVTPDHYVVDKISGAALARGLGAKERSLHLLPGGGHEAREGFRADELTLNDERLTELAALIARVEALYGLPVDIEWAVADGALFLLQARPITAWVPLPDDLMTAPGERRRLYQDIALSGGLTINAPISPIGQSWFTRFGLSIFTTYLGGLPEVFTRGDALWLLTGGRMYQDLSNILWLSSPGLLARSLDSTDALVAATLRGVDAGCYRAPRRPAWVSPATVLAYLRMVWGVRGALGRAWRMLRSPEAARDDFRAAQGAFEDAWRQVEPEGTLRELIERRGPEVIQHTLEVTMPALGVGMVGVTLAQAIAPKEHAALADRLGRGFEGNEVVAMGRALHGLAALLRDEDRADPERLAERLAARALPGDFLAAWDRFLHDFGWRGPDEVDLGAPRYADAPVLALRQLCAMSPGGFDPVEATAASVRARRAAYETILGAVGPLRRWLLRRAHRWIDAFGGARDTPKHAYLLFFAAARRRLLRDGAALAAAGRLDRAEQVVDLTLDDLEAAAADPSVDLRARRAENTRFTDSLRAHVRAFPAVIDSRGRILRPEPGPATPGMLTGTPISPGVARGPAVVLTTPGEKPVRPGDVLVAHTTDPGWTPLFVNAAAVVLEVGGVLQHGAVVAREYGKPCVAGIIDAVDRLEDGQWVEVDGAAGTVKKIEAP